MDLSRIKQKNILLSIIGSYKINREGEKIVYVALKSIIGLILKPYTVKMYFND